MKPVYQGFEISLRAFGVHLYSAVRQIPDKPGKSEVRSFTSGVVTKGYTLYNTADNGVDRR